MVPWLITTSAWPVLTAHFAGATARVVVDPVIVEAATAAALALAGGALFVLVRGRPRRPRPHGRST